MNEHYYYCSCPPLLILLQLYFYPECLEKFQSTSIVQLLPYQYMNSRHFNVHVFPFQFFFFLFDTTPDVVSPSPVAATLSPLFDYIHAKGQYS